MNPMLRAGRIARHTRMMLYTSGLLFSIGILLLACGLPKESVYVVLALPPCLLFVACFLLLVTGPGTLVRVLACIPFALFAAVVWHVVHWCQKGGYQPRYILTCYGSCVLGWPIAFLSMKAAQSLAVKPEVLDGFCVHCGYDLTGNVTGVCSECGRRFRPPSQYPPMP